MSHELVIGRDVHGAYRECPVCHRRAYSIGFPVVHTPDCEAGDRVVRPAHPPQCGCFETETTHHLCQKHWDELCRCSTCGKPFEDPCVREMHQDDAHAYVNDLVKAVSPCDSPRAAEKSNKTERTKAGADPALVAPREPLPSYYEATDVAMAVEQLRETLKSEAGHIAYVDDEINAIVNACRAESAALVAGRPLTRYRAEGPLLDPQNVPIYAEDQGLYFAAEVDALVAGLRHEVQELKDTVARVDRSAASSPTGSTASKERR